MYIREIQKKNPSSPKAFISHRLIESVRTPRGPRQRVVHNLGRLDIPKDQWKALANRIEELLHGYEHVTVPVPIPIIPPPDSEGIRHLNPMHSASGFRLIPPPLVGA